MSLRNGWEKHIKKIESQRCRFGAKKTERKKKIERDRDNEEQQ